MESETNKTTVSVEGSARAIRPLDIAYTALYVRTNGILLDDAIKQATEKLKLINKTLKDTFPEIQEIELKDIYVGETKSYAFGGRDKADPPQPEVIKGLLVITPPNSDLTTKIVDTASRMGCIIQNPTDAHIAYYPRSVVLYGLVDYENAEQEAIENAIADAKENASKAGKILNQRVGAVQKIAAIDILRIKVAHDEGYRLNRNLIVYPTCYLSVSPNNVEVSIKVSVTFELENNPE